MPPVSNTITHVIMHRGMCRYCCAFHKNSYRFSAELDSWFNVVYNVSTIKLMEVTAMLKISELAMPKSRKVTTICNGRREVWADYEEAKAYFLELMISRTARSMNVLNAFIFSLCTDLMSAVMLTNNLRG